MRARGCHELPGVHTYGLGHFAFHGGQFPFCVERFSPDARRFQFKQTEIESICKTALHELFAHIS